MKTLIILLLIIWIYLITVLTRAKLHFFKFLIGSVGLFFFMMIILQPYLVYLLSRLVASVSGIIGNVTGYFESFTEYSMIMIRSGNSFISMYIDYECSGVIEILAFNALLWFFPLYNTVEKYMYSVVGTVWIFIANIVRILIICMLVHYYGNNMFYPAHTIFGRIVFYIFSIYLYFYVFTRSQIRRQKVGNIVNENNFK